MFCSRLFEVVAYWLARPRNALINSQTNMSGLQTLDAWLQHERRRAWG